MQTKYFLQLLALSAVWGASFPLIRVAAPEFGPIPTAFLRCILAAAVLGLIMRHTGQKWPEVKRWPQLVFLGVLTVVAPFILYNWAGLLLPAGYSAVLNATAPIFGLLSGVFSGEEKFTSKNLMGCVFGLLGVSLLVGLGPIGLSLDIFLAIGACLLAAACFGFGATLMKKATLAHQPLPASTMVHMAGALVLIFPAALTSNYSHVRNEAWVAIIILGAVTSGLMYWLSMRLMKDIPASAATCSAFLIPMFGIAWGTIFLGEPLTIGIFPGVLLVLAAAALVTGFNPFALKRHSA